MRKNPAESISHRLLIFTFVCWFAFQVTSAEPPVKSVETLAALQQRLSNHITEPRFAAASWGVKVVSLETGRTLFEHNAEKLFSPASNSKLYTTALALDRLGADYRIKTSLYATTRPNLRGNLPGDVIVYGRGDPTLNARLNGGDIYQALEPLVAVLTKAGVKRVEGDLIGDDSYFRGPPFGSGWVWDDTQSHYGAELSALTINDNFLQLSVKPGERVGAPCRLTLNPATTFVILSNRTQTVGQGLKRSIALYRPPGENVTYVSGQLPIDDADYTDNVTVHNPAGLFVTFFKEALAWHGVKVSGRTRTLNWLDRQMSPFEVAKYVELGVVESLPLRDLVREIQKPSQNLYADLLLAHVGANSLTTNTPPPQTSEESGIAALESFLSQVGIGKGDVQFEEGSGLSRNNLTTPNATIALLQFMSRHKWAEVYRDALPVAGVDGTLHNRMKDTPAAGNLRAKTGTLRWANSLSGFVTTTAGERLVFSIMLNRYHNTDPFHSARDEIDAIAIMLAGFTGHTARPDEK